MSLSPALISTAPPCSFTATTPAVTPRRARLLQPLERCLVLTWTRRQSWVCSSPGSACSLGFSEVPSRLPPTALATPPPPASLLVTGRLSHAAELGSSQLSPRPTSVAQMEVVLCLHGLPDRCHGGLGGCPPEACAFPPQAWSGVVLVIISVSVAGPPPLCHAEAPCSPGTQRLPLLCRKLCEAAGA